MILVRDMLRLKGDEVWTVQPEATVYDALALLADKDIGAAPVVKDGQVVGMFSERDYARKVILKGRSSRDTRVDELMSTPVITIGPDQTIEACMALMTNRRIRHLPVLQEGTLIGLISIGDVVKAIVADQQIYIRDLEKYIAGAPNSTHPGSLLGV